MRSRSGPRSAISVSIARWNTGQISGVSSRITKLTMPSLCEASATKPEWRSMASVCPVSIRHLRIDVALHRDVDRRRAD